MARTVKDASLETRAARGRLGERTEPYWRAIDQGSHLGYYKGARGGSWIARFYHGGKYHKSSLGTADDRQDADGVAILNFREAQAKARAWFSSQARLAAGLEPSPSGPYTVENAMSDYLAWFEAHRKGTTSTRSVINTHILPSLGTREVAKLTPIHIRAWHEKLALAPARLRSTPGGEINSRATSGADGKRSRRATANRIFTVLKAALNHAWRDGKVPADSAWRKVRPFRDVDAAVVRYLTQDECVRLINSCEPDFRKLVQGALLTGCRYGELTSLKMRDFNPDSGTLIVRSSKSGKPRHVVLTEEGQRFIAELGAGRAPDATLFIKGDGQLWKSSHQRRPLIEACGGAKIDPPASFHILRHTHGSLLAMRKVPLAVIAEQLGHADTRMTSKHYAHLSPSYVADAIRAGFPNLGIVSNDKVTVLKPKFAGG